MNYNIFLDDIRDPTYLNSNPKITIKNWTVVRNYEDFVKLIEEKGIPDFISYDHDLCREAVKEFIRVYQSSKIFNYNRIMKKTGLHCARFLIEKCEELDIPHPNYYIHSQNFIGAENIEKLIKTHNKKYEKSE